jgi:hypothetical protein
MTIEEAAQKITDKVLSLKKGWKMIRTDIYAGHSTFSYAHDQLPKDVRLQIYGGQKFDRHKGWVILSDRSCVGVIEDRDFIRTILDDIADRDEVFKDSEVIKLAQSL